MHRFVSFLAVYGAINGFRIIRRFADAVTPDQPIYALWMLHSFFGPIQGLGNALVYGWTPRVRRLYAERFPRWCARLAAKHPNPSPNPNPNPNPSPNPNPDPNPNPITLTPAPTLQP